MPLWQIDLPAGLSSFPQTTIVWKQINAVLQGQARDSYVSHPADIVDQTAVNV